MDKQSINKRLIDQYLSGPDGLGRLYREREKRLSSAHAKTGEDDLPEVNARVLELAREAGTEIARRHRRRFYVPMALAASVLVAVVAVKLLLPTADSPDIHMLGSESTATQGHRKAEKMGPKRDTQDPAVLAARKLDNILYLLKAGRHEEAAKEYGELRQQYPDYPIPDFIPPLLEPGKSR